MADETRMAEDDSHLLRSLGSSALWGGPNNIGSPKELVRNHDRIDENLERDVQRSGNLTGASPSACCVFRRSGNPVVVRNADDDNLLGTLAIAAHASLGADNNLTRTVSLSDPLQIVQVKGASSGPSTHLGCGPAARFLRCPAMALSGAVGFLGYGEAGPVRLALRHSALPDRRIFFDRAVLRCRAAVLALNEPVTAHCWHGH